MAAAPIRLRAAVEIQRAHDILHGQVTGTVPFVLNESARPLVRAALDVLCWVLRHDHANGFPHSLADVERGLLIAGYHLAPLEGD